MVVLVGVTPLVLVVLALFAYRQRLTETLIPTGLASIAGGFVLQIPFVGRPVDSALSPIGANISHIGHIILAGLAWWVLGIAALRVIGQRSSSWLHTPIAFVDIPPRVGLRITPLYIGWSVLNTTAGIVTIAVWEHGAASRIEVTDLVKLQDSGTKILFWIFLMWALVGGILLVTAAAPSLREDGVPRYGVWLMICTGACGIGYAVHTMVLMAMGTPTLQTHYEDVTFAWALPGLWLLAWIGWKAVRASMRREPRPTAQSYPAMSR